MRPHSIITKHTDCCLLCGNTRAQIHHCIGGTANRRMADEDGLVIPLCEPHHTGHCGVHKFPGEMGIMARIIGQLAYEKEYYRKACINGRNGGMEPENQVEDDLDPAREVFRKRYGKSYL